VRAVPVAVAGLAAMLLLVAKAPAAGSSTDFLAPPTACAGSADAGASVAVQRRALVCLVNWARRRARLRALAQHPALSRSADAKAATIVSCGDFSHAPCGRSVTGTALAAGYRFAAWAENLYWGSQDLGTARAAMQAWLLSPPHRQNVFARGVRDAGIGRVRTPSFAGSSDVTVWVLEIGRRR
jgi:uncharacterized protein YkwD